MIKEFLKWLFIDPKPGEIWIYTNMEIAKNPFRKDAVVKKMKVLAVKNGYVQYEDLTNGGVFSETISYFKIGCINSDSCIQNKKLTNKTSKYSIMKKLKHKLVMWLLKDHQTGLQFYNNSLNNSNNNSLNFKLYGSINIDTKNICGDVEIIIRKAKK